MENKLDRFAEILIKACHVLSVGFLAILFVLINVEVFARYVLNRSTLLADEYGGYLFVSISFFGFAHALRSGQFLRVSFVVDLLAPRAKLFLHWIAIAVMTWEVGKLVLVSWQFGSVSIQPSSTPLIYPQGMMALGTLVLLIAFLAELSKSTARIVRGDWQEE